MNKVSVNAQGVYTPDPAGSFSQATRIENLIFTTGITARDASGAIVGHGNVRAQTQQVFENIKRILASQGASMDEVVKRTVYLKDINDLPEVYKVMAEYFTNPDTYPACACIQPAQLANPDYLVEVEVVAAVRK